MFYYIMHKLLGKQLMHNKLKKPKTGRGSLEMRLLAYVQMRKLEVVRTGDISAALKITPKQERELLSRLNRSGMIVWLKRGAYLVPPRIPAGGQLAVSENYILSMLMKELKGKYQVSGPNAFNFYGFDNQVPNRVYVYNNRIYGEKNIGGFDFVFIKTSDDRIGSASESQTPTGEKICMVTKARALLDAVYDWSRYDTIPRAYRWILMSIENSPEFRKEFIKVALKFGNKGTIRRIGYLLAEAGVPGSTLKSFQEKAGSIKSLIKLNPKGSAKGPVNKEWGLIINGAIVTD
jgi:predicted transcriptional regulator of viral defense system